MRNAFHGPFTDQQQAIHSVPQPTSYTLEISDDHKDRLDEHREEGQSHEELVEELVSMYETEGAFLQDRLRVTQ